MIEAFHIVDVFVVPHCFTSFQIYGGLLIVPLFGILGFVMTILLFGHCSLFQCGCCCLCEAQLFCAWVVVCVTLMMFWSLLVVQHSCCFA